MTLFYYVMIGSYMGFSSIFTVFINGYKYLWDEDRKRGIMGWDGSGGDAMILDRSMGSWTINE